MLRTAMIDNINIKPIDLVLSLPEIGLIGVYCGISVSITFKLSPQLLCGLISSRTVFFTSNLKKNNFKS